jgi:ribosomal protein S18 acetylase RimI-like enzyme
MEDQAAEYLETSINAIGLTMADFREKFSQIGEVVGIYENDRTAGFYWIEKRGTILHIHALILGGEFQGRRLGRTVLAEIENKHSAGIETIELGVHDSNRSAMALYNKANYETVKTLAEVGFHVMHKRMGANA